MRPHKHTPIIVASLLVLCVVIAVALSVRPAQAPSDAPAPSSEQPTPAATSEQPTKPSTTPAEPSTPGAQDTSSASAEDPAAGLPTSDSATTDVTAAPAVEQDAPFPNEEMERQVLAAIPHVEQPKVAPDVAYEPGVVLVTVREGTSAEQLSQAITAAGITSVEPDDVEVVTDDLMMVKLAPSATIDDAIYELESTGIAKGAQPNYVYEIAEEPTLVPNDTESALENTPTSSDVETTDSTSPAEPSDASEQPNVPESAVAPEQPNESEPTAEPTLAVETATSEGQPDTAPTIDVQDATSTPAKDVLNDPNASAQWDLDSIDAPAAWEFPPLKNATNTVGVGILDNGFNDAHEDLVDNVRSTYNATTKAENVSVRCPNGTPDPAHGSHVAGIVGATSNNGKGISGVGFNHLKLSLVSLTDERNPSGITTTDVVKGFDYLIKHKDQYNIRVASMSLGVKVDSLPTDNDILNAIDKAYGKGIVTVASAGNETWDATPPYINYPSDYATVISVMNLRNTDVNNPKSVERSKSSNYNAPGEESKNISAPGTDIYSTYPDGYGLMSGTSMAAPHVTGVVGLMFTVNPTLSPDQAKELLYNSARDIGAPGWDEQYGHGEVNALSAVRAAATGTINGPAYVAVGATATYAVGTSNEGWSFSSSDPNVLSFGEGGTATAVSAGIAIVSASNGSTTFTQRVTVLGPISGNGVAKNGSVKLSIATPDGCGELAWDWTSDNESVATVTDDGVVYDKDSGTATITAKLRADERVQLSYDVTVYDALKGTVYVPMKDTGTSTATLTPDTSSFASPTMSWTSSNEQVATVDSNGMVTAKSAGGTVVSCTIQEGDTSTTNVWCVYVYGPIEGATSVGVEQSTQLKIAGLDNVSSDLQAGWTWSLGSSSDSAVASVSSDNGTVTGKKTGTVTITASRGSRQDQVSFSHEMTVRANSLANAQVTIPRQTYTGSKLTPVPVVTLGGTTLKEDVDYEIVAHADFVNVSSYNVTIQGKGTYAGTATGTFVVEPKKLKPPKAVTGLVYNGLPQTGVPAGDGYKLDNDVTKIDADEYLAFAVINDSANTDDHTNVCWENGSTLYRIEWSIAPRPASDLNVEVPGTYVYNGSAHTPKPTVTWNGKPLKTANGDDFDNYNVSYANNVNAGTATVTVTFEEGNFKGTKTATFNIAPAPSSVGIVTAADVRDSLDPADVVLTRSDTSLPGRLALTETELSYGTNTYHWTFTPDDANHAPSSGTVEITVTGHEWGAPTYTWAEDDSSCTAQRVCANNPAHVEEETVDSVREVVAEPTTENEGKATFTAKFQNEAFVTQVKEVALPKLPAHEPEPAPESEPASEPDKTEPPVTPKVDRPADESTAPKSDGARLADTSDETLPIMPVAIAGAALLALATLKRRN